MFMKRWMDKMGAQSYKMKYYIKYFHEIKCQKQDAEEESKLENNML